MKRAESKKMKRRPGTIRSILKRPPAVLKFLGSLRFPWSNPDMTVPSRLHFCDYDAISITADDIDLEISPLSIAIFSNYLHTVSWVYSTESTNQELCLDVYPKSLPMSNAEILVEKLFGITYTFEDNSDENFAWDGLIKELVGEHAARNHSGDRSQHPELRATLRGYQAKAVSWMMERESTEQELNMDWMPEVANSLTLPNQVALLYNKFTGTLFEPFGTTMLQRGGILADEMGLGKTVITLALILNNQRANVPSWELTKESNHFQDDEFEESDEDCPKRRKQNQERTLNATEKLQLVPSKPGRGILMRQMTSWYESQLAEMAPKSWKKRRQRRARFKCICGDEIGRRSATVVKCNSCQLKQHAKCVGFKENLDYVCPACWKQQELVPSRATLIITPPAIFQQWAHEIEKHAPSLKTFLYTGIRDKFVQPTFLADFDVVVTTFPILRSETTYGSETSERTLRNESRFLRQTCALECVDWWRVVCDEAQMFESDASMIRLMVNRLQAVQRWCVTGTPIQKEVADLFYLTSFMGMGPFDEKRIWTEFLLKPYLAGCKTPLLSALGQVFWRSTKDQVCDELGIPEQTFQRHLMNFSATESFFYSQIHEMCSKNFAVCLAKSKIDSERSLASLDKSTIKRLLEPLLNLRQACTHPQIVAGVNILREGKVSTLNELLDYLCKKTKIECDDAIREHVGALNGIAGLYWLEGDYKSAVENYRSILRLSEESNKKSDVHVDTLQLIHTMTNLNILLEEHPGAVAPTMRDASLPQQIAELEKKYLGKTKTALEGSVKEAEDAAREVDALYKTFELSPMAWWAPVLMATADYESELLFKINEQLDTNEYKEKEAAKKFLNSVKSIHGIEIVIRNWWTQVEECHEIATQAIDDLLAIDDDQLVRDALKCHLRNNNKNKCQLCEVENALLDLECQLFHTSRKDVGKKVKVLDGADTRYSWKANRAECLLNVVVNFAKTKWQVDRVMLKDRAQHVKLIETMKKQFKLLRAVWTALNHCVLAQDELTMAKWRMRFAEPWERVKTNTKAKELALALSQPEEAQKIHIVYPEQVPHMMAVLKANDAFKTFEQKRGKLFYLRNLGKNENVEPDPCPICRNELKTVWTVLTCGHCYCVKCFESISGFLISCPVCRQKTKAVEVSFVEDGALKKTDPSPDDGLLVANYSAKVDRIVVEVLRLTREDPQVKIIIFSTWKEVLKILSEAFVKNNVTSLSLPSQKHQKILEDFKNMHSGVSVLLLPLAWGSKGLNLVEATHVFLIEPILNPAEELQAIGRVHRIGQTRPTVVHRFIMKQTIEEKIFEVVSEAKDTWTKKEATLNDLKNLFSKSDV